MIPDVSIFDCVAKLHSETKNSIDDHVIFLLVFLREFTQFQNRLILCTSHKLIMGISFLICVMLNMSAETRLIDEFWYQANILGW